MQVQRKTAAFLLPGMLLFFGLTIFLFNLPAQCPLIALLFFTFVLTTAFLISLEMAAVFGVLVTLIEFGGIAVVPASEKGWMAGHIVVLWAGVFIAQRFGTRDITDERQFNDIIRGRQEELLSLQKEKESLDKRLIELDNQASLRRHLFDAVQQLASLMDPVMVRQRLMEFVRSIIGRGTIHYFAGNQPRDLGGQVAHGTKPLLFVTGFGNGQLFQNSSRRQ